MAKPVYRVVRHTRSTGSTTEYRLSRGEYDLYAAAVERGLFVSNEHADGLAFDAYDDWCATNQRPFVAVLNGRRTSEIRAHIFAVPWWLTPEIQDEIRWLFGSSAWIKGYVEEGTAMYSGVPKARACDVANRLVQVLREARKSWRRYLAGLPAVEDPRG